MPLGHWLRKPKKESFELKEIFFRLLMSWLHKFQCDVTVFASLTSARGHRLTLPLKEWTQK